VRWLLPSNFSSSLETVSRKTESRKTEGRKGGEQNTFHNASGAYTQVRQGQHQQNRRGRGRSNNNNNGNGGSNNQVRKGQNPLSRSFESNGPDVKVRGTPAHIAEKYQQLARDAQSAGDRVLAENYLQHAEHYNRIIMAYREQFQTPGDAQNAAPRTMGSEGFEFGDEGAEDSGESGTVDFGGGPQPGAMPNAAQPSGGEQGGASPNQPQHQRPFQQHQRQDNRQDNRFDRDRQGYQDRNSGGDAQQRGDRPFRRDDQQQNRYRDRNDRNDRNFRPNNGPNNGQQGQNQNQGDRDRGYGQRFERGDRPQQNRGENRGDFRQDRGPRQDRLDRQDGGEPRTSQSQDAPRPVNPIEQNNPGFTPAPLNVPPPVATPIPTPAPTAGVADAAAPAPRAPAAPRRRERVADAVSHEQPEFLRRPVRRTKAATPPSAEATKPVSTPDDDSSAS
jgi:Domain of unknown function (DUF4167)